MKTEIKIRGQQDDSAGEVACLQDYPLSSVPATPVAQGENGRPQLSSNFLMLAVTHTNPHPHTYITYTLNKGM